MNLLPPPARKFFAWTIRRKAAALDYFKATKQLSALTVTATYQGRTVRVGVTYTGKNAKFDLPLDSLLQ